MLLPNLILTAFVAVTSVSAAPGTGSAEVALLARGSQTCLPGKSWSGFQKQCKCDGDDKYDDDYDYEEKKCRPKPVPKNPCGRGEKQWCAKSADEYCEYDKKHPYCYNDKSSKVFCCKEKDLHKKLKEVCPSHPRCDEPRKWNWDSGKCECPKDKIWHDGKCVWKPIPKPRCSAKKAYCAKDAGHFCPYDDWHPWCGDDGKNIVFCCKDKPGKPEKKCKKKWDNGKDYDDDDDEH